MVKKMNIANKEELLTKKNERKHELSISREDPDKIMEVWIRDITFFDVQVAAQKMFNIDSNGDAALDLEGYWKHAFKHWVVRTNPHLEPRELYQLNAYVGEQLSAVLPKPNDLAKAMQSGFTSANN